MMTNCNDSIESINSNNLSPIPSGVNSSLIADISIDDQVCKDENTVTLSNTDNFAYSPTIQIYQLDKLRAEFEKSAVITTGVNPFIENYGQEAFNQSLISFNNFLLTANANEFLNIAVNYPLVKSRIDKGVAITTVEFYEFMADSGYNPVSITGKQTTDPRGVLSLYNSHINGRFSKSTMGAFCEIAPSIFGAVAGFFTALSNLASKITDIINSIQNFSLSSLLDSLKSKIMNVIESAINKVKSVIQNFTLQGLVTQAQQFFHTQILYRFKEIKDKALAFFDENNIEAFKKRVEGLISYAASLFKNPDIEEIQFLIYRFCSFITQVEDIINSIRKPLDNFSNRYVYAGNILTARSNLNTASAIAAGAKRFSISEISNAISAGIASETAIGNSPPPTPQEVEGATPWNNGSGDSRVTFGSGPKSDGPESWSRVVPEVKVKLMRLQQRFGRQLTIISAYRSTEKQAKLYADDLASNGGVPTGDVAAPGKSLHETGRALDIRFSGLNSQTASDFIATARAEGFGGAKYYRSSNFVHIDIGPVRTW